MPTVSLLLTPTLAVPAQKSAILSGEPPIVVFAAAGATDAVTALCREYEAASAAEITLSFASSSTLARQIEAGAEADVFISANKQWMDYVQDKGVLSPETRTDWASNRLALVAPKGTGAMIPKGANRAELLSRLAGIRGKIAVGDPGHVPAGMYAKQALESACLYESLKSRLVACPSVRAAMRLVEEGQVETGIVYQSDAVTSDRVTVVGIFPQQWHDPITFQIGLLRGRRPSAASLAEFLTGAHASRTLTQFGFGNSHRAVFTSPTSASPSASLWRLTEPERAALAVSLRVALTSVLLLIAPGIFLGYVLARKDFAGKTLVEGLVHAPLVLPPIVLGYLLLLLLGPNGPGGRWLHQIFGIELAFTFKAAVLASAVVALPLMVRSVRTAVAVADRGLEAAAYTLGAGPIRTFLLVTLPLVAPGVIAGTVLAFARSLGEFGATAVFMGNLEGQRTLPLAIYSALQTAGGDRTVWRLAALSVFTSLVAVVISEVLTRRAGRILEQSRAT